MDSEEPCLSCHVGGYRSLCPGSDVGSPHCQAPPWKAAHPSVGPGEAARSRHGLPCHSKQLPVNVVQCGYFPKSTREGVNPGVQTEARTQTRKVEVSQGITDKCKAKRVCLVKSAGRARALVQRVVESKHISTVSPSFPEGAVQREAEHKHSDEAWGAQRASLTGSGSEMPEIQGPHSQGLSSPLSLLEYSP